MDPEKVGKAKGPFISRDTSTTHYRVERRDKDGKLPEVGTVLALWKWGTITLQCTQTGLVFDLQDVETWKTDGLLLDTSAQN